MEENFDRLRKALSLKRHETAPPGYFRDFSTKVMARIESAEATRNVTWWQRLVLDFRPAMVCGLGVVVCGLLSAGVIASVFQDADQPIHGMVMMNPPGVSQVSAHPLIGFAGEQPSSTQPVFSASKFDQFGVRIGAIQPANR